MKGAGGRAALVVNTNLPIRDHLFPGTPTRRTPIIPMSREAQKAFVFESSDRMRRGMEAAAFAAKAAKTAASVAAAEESARLDMLSNVGSDGSIEASAAKSFVNDESAVSCDFSPGASNNSATKNSAHKSVSSEHVLEEFMIDTAHDCDRVECDEHNNSNSNDHTVTTPSANLDLNPINLWRSVLNDVDATINEQMKLQDEAEIDITGLTGWTLWYMTLAKHCRRILTTSQWVVFMFCCIVVAGILAGALTYPGATNLSFVRPIELFIVSVFIVELLMKIIAQGLSPWHYFSFSNNEWRWNWLDFMVVMCTLPAPYIRGRREFQLLRLLRFLRMINHVSNLKLIISGFTRSLNFVSYIVLLWFMIIYIYAVLGIELFGVNDPWHFKSMEIATVSLFLITVNDVSACVCACAYAWKR